MENNLVILCFAIIILENVSGLLSEDSKLSKVGDYGRTNKADDLEGAETVGKLFDLRDIFPSYGTSQTYYPNRYPSTGAGYNPSSAGRYCPPFNRDYYPGSTNSGGYYPGSTNSGGYYPTYSSSNGFYPSSANYPNSANYPSSGYNPSSTTGTNILGYGSSGYPSASYNPSLSPWCKVFGTSSSRGYGGYGNYASNGGYGGYGGNGGLNSYYGYNNPRYDGARNLGFGYYSDTDRYGFNKSPSQQLSVSRGYN